MKGTLRNDDMAPNNGKKISVAVIIDEFCVGGAEKQLTELLPLFDRNTFDVSFIVLYQFEGRVTLYDQLPEWLPVYKLNFRNSKDIMSWVELYKTLRTIKPDVVMPNLFFSNTSVRMLKPLLGYKVIITEHNTYIDKSRKQIFIDKALSYLTYKIVAVSSTVATFTAEQERIPKEKFVVIHNGVDVGKIQSKLAELPSKDALRKEFGFTASDKILLNVAGLKSKKRHKIMLDGFALFHKKYPEYRLAIAGEGPLRSKLEVQARELGIGDVVTFFGLRRDIEKFYKMSDIFVSTSDIEGLSIAYLEALASGLPVVSTKTSGTDELITNGENGFFIPESSPEAVSETLEKMANANLNQMGDKARVKVNEFDIHKTAEKYSELIIEACKK